jgi:hypothetical protein
MSTQKSDADRKREWLERNPEKYAEYQLRKRERNPSARKRVISIDHLANEIARKDRG